MVHELGWTSFSFDWLVNPDMAIYTVVIAGVWQASGFVMALFLAGLRGIDDSIIKAAQVDGASLPTIYRRIIIPSLRPVFFSAFIILTHIAIKSFDLVIALTGGGPGFATDLPATFMYTFAFTRDSIGLGAGGVDDDADGGRGDHRPLPVFGTARHSSWLIPSTVTGPGAIASAGLIIYALLLLAAFYFLLPLFVMITTSLKALDEIRTGDLLSLPSELNFDAWAKAWGTACTGVSCDGLNGYFWNSVLLAVPAVLISTLIGALNGYVLTQWRFRGSQPVLRPAHDRLHHPVSGRAAADGRTLGSLGLADSTAGADSGARRLWPGLHHAVLPQLLRDHSGGTGQGGEDRRRRVLDHLLAHHPAAVDADHRGLRDLAVHPDLERLPVRRGVSRPATVSRSRWR